MFLYITLFFTLFASFFLSTLIFGIKNQGVVSLKKKKSLFVLIHNKVFSKSYLSESYFFCALFSIILFSLIYGSCTLFISEKFLHYSSLSSISIFIILFIIYIYFITFIPKLWILKSTNKAQSISEIIASFFLMLTLPLCLFPLYLIVNQVKNQHENSNEDYESIQTIKEKIVRTLNSPTSEDNISSFNVELAESALKFKDVIVREVMIPRVDLFSLSGCSSVKIAAQAIVKEGYSRIPVYENSIDNIIGVLMFKDILEIYMNCEEKKCSEDKLLEPISQLVKPAIYTPEIKKASQLLQELRAKHCHMAIVVDEYGGTEGVVTMEDLLEELVGEIDDEYDLPSDILYKKEGNSWIVDARMSIDEAEKVFNINLGEENTYDTLGGHVFHKSGSVPKKGFKIHHENFDMEILSCSDRSIGKLKLTPINLEKSN